MSSRPPPLPPPAPPPKRPGGSSPPPPSASAPPAAAKAPAKGKPATPPTPAKERAPFLPVERTPRIAALALVGFTSLTIVTLAAWFARADQPWGIPSFVMLLTAILSAGAAALFRKQPTREHAMGGLVVMVFSLVRVALPASWDAPVPSIAIITITALFAIPVVQAVIALPRS